MSILLLENDQKILLESGDALLEEGSGGNNYIQHFSGGILLGAKSPPAVRFSPTSSGGLHEGGFARVPSASIAYVLQLENGQKILLESGDGLFQEGVFVPVPTGSFSTAGPDPSRITPGATVTVTLHGQGTQWMKVAPSLSAPGLTFSNLVVLSDTLFTVLVTASMATQTTLITDASTGSSTPMLVKRRVAWPPPRKSLEFAYY